MAMFNSHVKLPEGKLCNAKFVSITPLPPRRFRSMRRLSHPNNEQQEKWNSRDILKSKGKVRMSIEINLWPGGLKVFFNWGCAGAFFRESTSLGDLL
jgi:hypothetical protein